MIRLLSVALLGLSLSACDFSNITGSGGESAGSDAANPADVRMCTSAEADEAPSPETTRFVPLQRTPPAFPEACRSLPTGQYSVSVRFGIGRDGTTENICILETADNCFNANAAEAVRGFLYEWAGEGRKSVAETGRGLTLQFQLEDQAGETGQTP